MRVERSSENIIAVSDDEQGTLYFSDDPAKVAFMARAASAVLDYLKLNERELNRLISVFVQAGAARGATDARRAGVAAVRDALQPLPDPPAAESGDIAPEESAGNDSVGAFQRAPIPPRVFVSGDPEPEDRDTMELQTKDGAILRHDGGGWYLDVQYRYAELRLAVEALGPLTEVQQ